MTIARLTNNMQEAQMDKACIAKWTALTNCSEDR